MVPVWAGTCPLRQSRSPQNTGHYCPLNTGRLGESKETEPFKHTVARIGSSWYPQLIPPAAHGTHTPWHPQLTAPTAHSTCNLWRPQPTPPAAHATCSPQLSRAVTDTGMGARAVGSSGHAWPRELCLLCQVGTYNEQAQNISSTCTLGGGKGSSANPIPSSSLGTPHRHMGVWVSHALALRLMSCVFPGESSQVILWSQRNF